MDILFFVAIQNVMFVKPLYHIIFIKLVLITFLIDYLKYFIYLFLLFKKMSVELDVFVGNTIVLDEDVYQLWLDGHTG